MRKLVFLPLLLLLATAAFAATTATPSLTLTVSNVTETIRPGSSFTIQLRVVNNGEGTAADVTVSPDIKAPFQIRPGTQESAELGDISLGQIATAKLHIQVLPDTPEDTYDLNLLTTYKAGGKEFTLRRTVAITVEATPTLEITGAEYGEVYAGDYATLSLEITNIGNGVARNIRAVYANSSGPILPAGSAVSYLKSLDPGETTAFEIPLSISGDADAGAYSLGISVQYEDRDGTPQSTLSRTIGLRVASDIELKTYLDSGTVVVGTPSEIVVSVANTGPNTAHFLEVVPVVKPGIEISSGAVYIGNLDSDDFDTIDLKLTASEAGSQEIELTLLYKDQFNNENEVTRTVGINVLTPKEAAALQKSSSSTGYIALLVIAGAGYWYWRRRKKAQEA